MLANHRNVRNKSRRETKNRPRRRGRRITASAGGAACELIRTGTKNMKTTAHASGKFSGNGAARKNGAKRSVRVPVLKHPKRELEAAIQRYVDLFEFAPI